MIVGALSGLMAALLQSLSYFSSRHFIQRRPAGAGVQLLILGHLLMGLMAIILLTINFSRQIIWLPALLPTLSAALFSVGGQLGLMQAIKYAEPSRVSPLLTIKILIPAFLATIIGQPVGALANRTMTPWQWLAVLLCLVACLSINQIGGRMRTRALIAILFTATSFACSDWSIGVGVARFLQSPHVSILRASLLTQSCVYSMLGVIAVVFLPWSGSQRTTEWRAAAPFALTWFGSMLFLFFAFGQIGVVLGSILQCTRGFMTILLGAGLMYLGMEHIEPRQPRSVILRRIAAGCLMFLAISLYIVRDPRTFAWPNSGKGNPKADIRNPKQ
jgi:drug/metabolite transporter (DMT)-like permease